MVGIWDAGQATMSDAVRIPVATSESSGPARVTIGEIAKSNTGKVLSLVAGDVDSANANRLALQSALNAQAVVFIATAGTYFVDATINIGGNTRLCGVPGVTLKADPGMNSAILKNKNRASIVDQNIHVSDIIFDGDKANQTSAFSVVDMAYVQYGTFERCQFNGGLRTGTYPSVSSDGEGIVLRHCRNIHVLNCHAENNAYDGFKTRGAIDCTFTNNTAKDNGRAGFQISLDTGGNVESERIIVNGMTVLHTTGVNGEAAPACTGLYIHGANRCCISNLTVNGTQEGIGIISGDSNVFTGLSLRTIATTGEAAIALDGDAEGNVVSNFTIEPLSGASGNLIRFFQSNRNRISNGFMSKGGGTGTWAVSLESMSGSNVITDIMAVTGDYVVDDDGDGNTVTVTGVA